jgi:S-adenosylmethionine decarboxylase
MGSEHSVGAHVLLDLYGVPAARLDDLEGLRASLEKAARDGGAHVVDSRFSRFLPHGASGVVILAESHVAIHTWPELGFAAVDVFTCGPPDVASRVADHVVTLLAPTSCHRRTIARGQRGGGGEVGE